MESTHIAIVGGGINGCATAWNLAREGHQVTVFERWVPGAMASGWTLAGVRQSGRDPAELPLARAAVDIWATLDEELGRETGYTRDGNLRLARTEAEVDVIRRLVDGQTEAGLDLEFLPDGASVRAVAPAVSERVLAASFCPTDGHADPDLTVAAFRAAAERRGAVFRLGETVRALEIGPASVTGLVTDRRRIACDVCIVAAGILSNDLLAPLGLSVPMTVPMVTVVQTEPMQPLLKPVIGVAAANCAGRQERDGRLRFTSGAEPWHGVMDTEARPSVGVTAASLARTVESVTAVLPAFATARVARIWAGLLDLTPDGLPVIERAPEIDGLVIAAGFSGHGFGLGPMTGRLLRDLALGEEPRLPLDAFARARFAGAAASRPGVSLTLHG
jgi:sarcosine oxidase, subunit beta